MNLLSEERMKGTPLWLTLLVACILVIQISSCDSKRSQVILRSEGELIARVIWTGKSFTVTNRGSSDWQYVMLQVNSGDNAYLYATRDVKKGEAIKAMACEFFRATDRKKLDVNEIALLTFTICEGDPYSYRAPPPRFWRGIIYNPR